MSSREFVKVMLQMACTVLSKIRRSQRRCEIQCVMGYTYVSLGQTSSLNLDKLVGVDR